MIRFIVPAASRVGRGRSPIAPPLAPPAWLLAALAPKFIRAEELGIRLEIVRGLPIWEAAPVWKHQRAVDRIRATIQRGPAGACECVHAAGVYVQFPDGSLKRPDVAIFAREPDEEDDAITLIPEAVIEVVSKGYEAKENPRQPNPRGHAPPRVGRP